MRSPTSPEQRCLRKSLPIIFFTRPASHASTAPHSARTATATCDSAMPIRWRILRKPSSGFVKFRGGGPGDNDIPDTFLFRRLRQEPIHDRKELLRILLARIMTGPRDCDNLYLR